MAATLVLTSCAGGDPGADYTSQHAEAALSALEDARSVGADEQQLEVIESVAESGRDVLFSEYRAAILATVDCLVTSGFAIDGPWEERYNGQTYVGFGYAPPQGWSEEQMNAVYSECRFTHSTFIDLLYQANTYAKEYVDDAFARARPAIVECLAEYGYHVPGDGTIGEIAPAVMEVRDLFGEDADCYVQSGFSAALNG